MKIISKQKILQIFKELFKEYGIENINLEDFIFLSNKEGKIFIANADLKNFIDNIRFSNCGLYIMRIVG
ncbi:MAG: hypothetical protein QW483_00625, partial [Nanopusillaceae archaeon]